MAKTVTPDAISIIRSNPTPDSSGDIPELVVQVLDLKSTGSRNRFMSALSLSLSVKACVFDMSVRGSVHVLLLGFLILRVALKLG